MPSAFADLEHLARNAVEPLESVSCQNFCMLVEALRYLPIRALRPHGVGRNAFFPAAFDGIVFFPELFGCEFDNFTRRQATFDRNATPSWEGDWLSAKRLRYVRAEVWF